MDQVLEQCLARLPEGRSVMCVALGDGHILGSLSRDSEPDPGESERLGAAAIDLFQSPLVALDPVSPDGAANEALVAAADRAVIFLRGLSRPDIAIAYVLHRQADLGLALATSRLTVPEIEAVL